MSPVRGFHIGATAAVLTAAVYVAGCSNGSSTGPAPLVTPTPIPAASPTSVAASLVLSNDLVLPVVAGYGASLEFSSTPSPAGVTLQASGTTVVPSGVPTNMPSAMPSPVAGGPVPTTVVAAWTIVLNSVATVPSPTIQFTGLPRAPAGTAYYSFFADITAGRAQGYSGPATFSNGTATLPPGNSGPEALSAGDTYVLEVVNF